MSPENKLSDDPTLKTIQYTCKKCGWTYSSRNKSCPMCGAAMDLSEKDLVAAMEKFADVRGTYISREDAFGFLRAFKKKQNRNPTLDDLWNAATHLAKMDTMTEEQLKKIEREKKQKSDIKAQMEKMKAQKEKEIAEARQRALEEAQRRQEEDKKRQAEEAQKAKLRPVDLICPKCQSKNPLDSKFCMECGELLQ